MNYSTCVDSDSLKYKVCITYICQIFGSHTDSDNYAKMYIVEVYIIHLLYKCQINDKYTNICLLFVPYCLVFIQIGQRILSVSSSRMS